MDIINRRGFLALAGLAGASVVAVSGCSEITGNGGGDAKGTAGTTMLTLGADLGSDAATSNQFPENFNANGGGAAAPGLGLFYETLFRITLEDGGKLAPHLAESVAYNDAGTEATYTLRKGVTWNDGTPFTAADVVSSYNKVFGEAGPPDPKDPDNVPFLRKPVTKTDDHTVVVVYNTPHFQQDTNLSAYYPIYPAHIYGEQKDASKYVDKEPVGTGPGVLKKFSGTRIEFDVRDDYWGGKFSVKKIVIVPSGTVGNIQSQITKGKVDWADGGGQGVLTNFLKQAPENRYTFFPDGSQGGVQFNCNKAPTNDKYVRRALRAAIDYKTIQESVGTGYPIPSITGLNLDIYGDMVLPEHAKPAAQDAEGAKQALKDGGWTVKGGNLVKGGKSYPIDLMINLGNADHILIGPLLTASWKDVLGLEVKQSSRADQVFQKEIHDHSMAFWNTNLNGSPYNAYQAYSHANLSDKAQKAGYGNQGKWKATKEVNDALAGLQATNMAKTEKIKELIQVIQRGFVDEAPVAPLLSGGTGEMWTVKNWTGFPELGKSDYPPRVNGYNNIGMTAMNLKPGS